MCSQNFTEEHVMALAAYAAKSTEILTGLVAYVNGKGSITSEQLHRVFPREELHELADEAKFFGELRDILKNE